MKFIDWLIDKLAVFIAIGVGVATTATMLASFPPVPWASILMGILGGVMVLFQSRALVTRMHGLWRMLAVIIIFCDVSWFLTMALPQHQESVAAVALDSETARLDNAVDSAKAHRDELTRQLSEAQNRVTIDALAALLRDAQNQVTDAQNKRDAYRPANVTVEGSKLFMAIPNAVMDPKQWIVLVIGLAIAVSLQWTILAVLRGAVKRAKSEDRAATKPRRTRTRRHKTIATVPVSPAEFDPDMGGNL